MKSLLLIASLAFFSGSTHGAEMKTGTCTTTQFGDRVWRDLTVAEPRLQEHLDFIAEKSGDVSGTTVKMTNCNVRWPVNTHGQKVNGDRSVVMDKIWETYENGQWKSHIAGLKVVYSERMRTMIPKKRWVLTPEGYYIEEIYYVEEVGRRVQGFTICSGQACFELQIPFKGSGSRTPETLSRK